MPKLVTPSPPTSSTLRLPSRSRGRFHRQPFTSSNLRPLAQPRHDSIPDHLPQTWTSLSQSHPQPPQPSLLFSPTGPNPSITDGLGNPQNDHTPPDERILKLGKTLRTLSPLLPTILINPLPPQILSPSVTLHLFPSTHPHLPTVKGRTLYRAALWAVPVAWSSVPLVGNVKLQVLSERIVRAGSVLDPESKSGTECGDERLVVRWRTESHSTSTPTSTSTASTSPPSGPSSTSQSSTANTTTTKGLGFPLGGGGTAPIFNLPHNDHFTGLFIFSFDAEGRVLTQTIEHAEDARGWERTAKFVTLTDWLIGKARGSLDLDLEPRPALSSSSLALHGAEGEGGTPRRASSS
ncbi:hypothetical protein P175DRAFT_0436517 [Aspergillus ochraceoroseus IBT 24754]|uniref:Uncharacterized protein n=1 Tax=Aspergillus ochraceoroseus IBT 24754 TaxID=1392256 RepID=A0A2T5LX88_9EURO|nr:uncharacterized protein P175DRAFT_0436517 [Aspergillus ochraceoroseus IBT 24754]PTU20905.1 hypothetical protein P175DRAFT_0436517 [Aspergillus ochraceoroseus IBT 24754]